MEGKNKTNILIFILFLVISLVPFCSSLLLGYGVNLDLYIFPLSSFLLFISLITFKNGRKNIGRLIFFLSTLLVFVSEYLLEFTTPYYSFINAIKALIPYFALVPVFFLSRKHKKSSLIITALLWLIILFVVDRYTTEYVYLYGEKIQYSSLEVTLKIAVFSLMVGNLSLFLFEGDRNYLNYATTVFASLCMINEERIMGNSSLVLSSIFHSVLLSQSFWNLILVLIEYIIIEVPDKKIWEKKNIIFKNIVYQEVKPVKKRPRKIVYEVPPNVPKLKRDLTQNMDSVNKNN